LSLQIYQHPLSYVQRLENRCTDLIQLVVIHCTELPDLHNARQWGEKITYMQSQTGNSGHFYIDRDGRIEEWVPADRVAHHVRRFNDQSIGIELVNNGRYPNWFHSGCQQMKEDYPGVQIKAQSNLLDHLVSLLPGLEGIAGHETLDTDMLPAEDQAEIMIRRKLDPGPCFPWQTILDNTQLKQWTAKNR
jgi:N-acetylmuramoyl-L-alanine amidase